MFVHNGIYIKAVEEEDLEFLKNLRNDPSTWNNLTSIDMLTSHGQKQWLESISKDKTKKYFVVKSNNVSIGFIRCDEIDQLNRSIRIGADIHPEYRGLGLGVKIYDLLLSYCFNYLNMNRVWLLVLKYNNVAMSLYKKMGFIEEGNMRSCIYRNNQYHDCIMMSILHKEYFK